MLVFYQYSTLQHSSVSVKRKVVFLKISPFLSQQSKIVLLHPGSANGSIRVLSATLPGWLHNTSCRVS